MASAFEMTEKMDDEEFDEDQLFDELEGDLKKLFKEANKKNGDPVSKRIVEQMDDWLKSELQIAIDDYEDDNPRFEYRLRDPSLHND